MSVIAVCGLPGSGKTLFVTYLMRKHFKEENSLFKRIFKRKDLKVNVYSNFPIKFNKRYYSNRVSLDDFNRYQKWYMDSDVVLDEFQLYFDSLDFKNFPKNVTRNFQLHRHYGINNIYILSQHPSRIVKQARVLVCEFYEIVKMVKIPFTGLGFFRYNVYYNNEDFGKPTNVKKKDVNYRFKKRITFPFRYKKVFKSYDTKYMRCLVSDKNYINNIAFKDKYMDLKEVSYSFGIDRD